MNQTQTFEESIKKLNAIIEKMENQNIGLEQSLELYEEGISLTRKCQTILTNAEKKIEKLMEQSN
ncbi:MAG: exodeoxyribonuclease VII small subunit [Proteobacteria bacterium]|nr:exodeoxyribonuclease VII small subunit [Pseudomonadota bacterium]